MTNLLLIEDNPKHLADAKALLEDRVKVGAISGVDYATNLTEAEELLRTRKYDGIISDVFFPKEAGGIEEPLGLAIVEYALNHEIPFTLVSEKRYDELLGIMDKLIERWLSSLLIASYHEEDRNERNKKWEYGYISVLYLKEAIERGILVFDETQTSPNSKYICLSSNHKLVPTVLTRESDIYDRMRHYSNKPFAGPEEEIPMIKTFREVVARYCSGMFDGMIKK